MKRSFFLLLPILAAVLSLQAAPKEDSERPENQELVVNPDGTVQVTDRKMEDGSLYTGPMKKMGDGFYRPHGFGIFLGKDGTKYVGDWKDGTQEGQGTLTRKDGRKYIGEWKNGHQNGHGIMTWPDGRQYDGEWKNGKMEGAGKMAYKSGKVEEGTWSEGKLAAQVASASSEVEKKTREKEKAKEKKQTETPKEPVNQAKVTPASVPRIDDVKPEPPIAPSKNTDKNSEAAPKPATPTNPPAPSPSGGAGGTLTVTGPRDYEIYSDGLFMGNLPAKLRLNAGRHSIEFRKPGYQEYRREIVVSDGSELTLVPPKLKK